MKDVSFDNTLEVSVSLLTSNDCYLFAVDRLEAVFVRDEISNPQVDSICIKPMLCQQQTLAGVLD